MIRRFVCCFVLLVGIVACGGGSDGPIQPPPPPPACAANTICMTGAAFYTTPTSNPPSVTVTAGIPVSWTNTSGVFHNVIFADQAAAGGVAGGSSGNIGEHTMGTNSRVFNATGAQNFQCTLHSNMIGVVVVQ